MRRSLTETIRLFRVIGTHRRDRALFLVAYRHGLRASEVGLLRVEDLDFKALRIMVHRLKGSHSGAHPLQPDEAKALKALLRARDPTWTVVERMGSVVFWQAIDLLEYGNRHFGSRAIP